MKELASTMFHPEEAKYYCCLVSVNESVMNINIYNHGMFSSRNTPGYQWSKIAYYLESIGVDFDRTSSLRNLVNIVQVHLHMPTVGHFYRMNNFDSDIHTFQKA